MSTNTVISNQDEERKLPLENTNKQTYIHDIHLMNSHQEKHIYTLIQHIRLSTILLLLHSIHTYKIALSTLLHTALINYV